LLGRVGWGEIKIALFSPFLLIDYKGMKEMLNFMLSISPHPTLSLWRGLLRD